MKKTVNINDIKIFPWFEQTCPSINKIKKCADYYSKNGEMDRDIVIDENGYLTDGYVAYLVLKNSDPLGDVSVIIQKNKKKRVVGNSFNCPRGFRKYIYAKHDENGKEYVWVMPGEYRNIPIVPGMEVKVATRCGNCSVCVTKVMISDVPPVNTPLKEVVSWS